MTEVIIAGIGQTPVGEHWELSLRALAVQAIRQALAEAAPLVPTALFAGNALAAHLSRQEHLGTLLADAAGLGGIEAVALEAGAASGGAALRQGYLAVASGLVEVALVVGVEKVTDSTGGAAEAALLCQGDSDYEAVHGLTPAAASGLLARRYCHEYQLPSDGLSAFPLTAHAHAVGNRHAMFPKAITLDAYRTAEVVCDPLTRMDLAPLADGAAALVLARREALPGSLPHPAVAVAASASVSVGLGLADRSEPLRLEAVRISTETALARAGLGREQIDLFELHDVSSILACLALEAAGYAKAGEGWKLAAEGGISLTGQIPCTTLGGSKARGEAPGATGVYQAVEAVLQLRAQAGKSQVQGARTAMIQCLAGPASQAVTHILKVL